MSSPKRIFSLPVSIFFIIFLNSIYNVLANSWSGGGGSSLTVDSDYSSASSPDDNYWGKGGLTGSNRPIGFQNRGLRGRSPWHGGRKPSPQVITIYTPASWRSKSWGDSSLPTSKTFGRSSSLKVEDNGRKPDSESSVGYVAGRVLWGWGEGRGAGAGNKNSLPQPVNPSRVDVAGRTRSRDWASSSGGNGGKQVKGRRSFSDLPTGRNQEGLLGPSPNLGDNGGRDEPAPLEEKSSGGGRRGSEPVRGRFSSWSVPSRSDTLGKNSPRSQLSNGYLHGRSNNLDAGAYRDLLSGQNPRGLSGKSMGWGRGITR